MDSSAIVSSTAVAAQEPTTSRLAQPNVAQDGLRCEWQGCAESYSSPEHLYEHICDRHIGRKSTNNLNLTCAWGNCTTTTVKRDHITSHVRVHVPLKPHKCEFCQKAFKRPQDLKKHVKTHAEDPNYHASPEQNRIGHHHAHGHHHHHHPAQAVFAGHKHELQHLAVSAYGYSDNHSMPNGQAAYSGYGASAASAPTAYASTPNNYQSTNYMTALYPVPQSNIATEYEVRKKATYDALNEFFGEMKKEQFTPSVYNHMSRKLMDLAHLPQYTNSNDFNSGATSVATAQHPPSLNHYSLPIPSIRTKGDLHHIDHFLEQLQSTVYDHETANSAAAAGVAQPGNHYIPTSGPTIRSSISPPRSTILGSGTILPPLTSTATDTPALTPESTAMSYHSPQSSTISPLNRPSYPHIASSHSDNYTSSGTATSLTSTTDHNQPSHRYTAGALQAHVPDKALSSKFQKLGVNSPVISNVDPALSNPEDKITIDPSLDDTHSAKSNSPFQKNDTTISEDPDWLVKVRVIEAMRGYIKNRLENDDFDDSSNDGDLTPRLESEEEKDVRSLYPVIRAVQEED